MPTFCVPTLSGLPGSPVGDFPWWVTPIDAGNIRFYPDNPNWVGGFSLSAGDGANEDVKFRCLKGNLLSKDYLLLQWIARTSTLSTSVDRVNALIGVPGGNYLAFTARLNTTSTTGGSPPGTETGGIFTYILQQCSVSGGIISGGSVVSDSAKFEETARMWVSVTSPTRLLQTDWAFQVAIELGTAWGTAPATVNIPTSGAFKLWFEVYASILGNPVPQQWPTTAPPTTGSGQIIPTGITESQMFDMSTAGAGCTDAVRLLWNGIGTRAVPGGAARPDQNTIKLDLGRPYPPLSPPYNDTTFTPDASTPEHQNQFFARPTLPAGITDPQKQSLRARFSIANWGSQLSEPTAASWRPIDRGTNVNFDLPTDECHVVWPIAADVGAPGSFLVTLVRNINKYLNAWAANPGNPMFPAGSQSPHQCMLVELSSLDPSVIITTSSVYTNMNVANASTFRRFAEISVVGAAPISERPRDVYLYLQKFNMPPVVKRDDQEKPPPQTFNLDQPRFLAAAAGGPRGGGGVEDIAALVPTYTVHGYMDTGKKYQLDDGTKVPILRRQTSFGYFVLHEGDLHGWETRLYGAEKLAENVYIVRVPNNGSVHVETAIQARENPDERPLPPDGQLHDLRKPYGCLGWLWGLFGHKKH